jgi:protein-disulfide isomerase
MDVNRWVDDRMAALDPPDQWRPDPAAALARLRRREGVGIRPRRNRWWLWITAFATAAAASIGLLMLSTPPACANPLGCAQPAKPAPPSTVPAPSPKPTASRPVVAPTQPAPAARRHNYKESGSPTAPLTCEVYTDYECPHCATFYLETLPQLVAAYVQTGKVRLIHRDFPLAHHRYAGLAARYANAAGENGYYDAAAIQIFRTQAAWSVDGDIDRQVAQVIPPALMAKVREAVRNDQALEESLAADQAMARDDHLTQTPTLVIVAKGTRQSIPGSIAFPLLKTYLDQLLAQQ